MFVPSAFRARTYAASIALAMCCCALVIFAHVPCHTTSPMRCLAVQHTTSMATFGSITELFVGMDAGDLRRVDLNSDAQVGGIMNT